MVSAIYKLSNLISLIYRIRKITLPFSYVDIINGTFHVKHIQYLAHCPGSVVIYVTTE